MPARKSRIQCAGHFFFHLVYFPGVFCDKGSHSASGEADALAFKLLIYAADSIWINGVFHRQVAHRGKLGSRGQLACLQYLA